MPTFRKIPVEIEAFRYGVDPQPTWFTEKICKDGFSKDSVETEVLIADTHCFIKTLEGTMTGETGDYIIKGVKGELYPCKPDIIKQTYVPS